MGKEVEKKTLWDLLKAKKGTFTEEGMAAAADEARKLGISEAEIGQVIRDYNLFQEKSRKPLFPLFRKNRKN